MMRTKIVLGLIVASLAVIQVSAQLVDPSVVTAIANATAAVATSSAAVTTAVNNAVASISTASATLAASSSITTGLQTLILPQVNAALVRVNTAFNTALPLAGTAGDTVLACLNNQSAVVAAIPAQTGTDLQSCVTAIVAQVNAYNADVLVQGTAAGMLGATAAAGFTNCTLFSLTVAEALACITAVGTTITGQATLITNKINDDVAAVDTIMTNLNSNLLQCGGQVLAQVAIQVATITQDIGFCSLQA